MSTQGLYHYPAAVTDTITTTAVVNFGPAMGFNDITNAVVINNFSGRKQVSSRRIFQVIEMLRHRRWCSSCPWQLIGHSLQLS